MKLRQFQSGTSLIEVLVTMVIIAIGLLGLAGLQATSMKNNIGASNRSEATVLVYDIIDRMRANKAGAGSGSYNIALGSDPSGGTLPATEVAEWKSALRNRLPSGDGSISATCNISGCFATVIVTWNDTRNANNLADTSFTTNTKL
ncbi:MAG: type IV pilus modification protein PilV [Gallionellaceae bacterium]|nr:type IV pilus modification protein PilV [Gallionellaceae bacterium]MDD5365234.1 type IV pilus modification protein PilV [Gallionellaceae bacterium]